MTLETIQPKALFDEYMELPGKEMLPDSLGYEVLSEVAVQLKYAEFIEFREALDRARSVIHLFPQLRTETTVRGFAHSVASGPSDGIINSISEYVDRYIASRLVSRTMNRVFIASIMAYMGRQVGKDIYSLKSSLWKFDGEFASKFKTTLSSLSVNVGIGVVGSIIALLISAIGLQSIGTVLLWSVAILFTLSIIHDVFAFRRMYAEIDKLNGTILACQRCEEIVISKLDQPSSVSANEIRILMAAATDADLIWPSCLYTLLDFIEMKRTDL